MAFAVHQTIKYQAEADPAFPEEIKAFRGCEKLNACIQCGTCSGVCPLSIYMEYTPRRIIHLTRAGFKDVVLRSNTIWLCSSCYECTVACPQEIKITDIMYALKQRAIQDRVYPRGFPIPVLAREFYKMVHSRGRTTESFLVLKLFLQTNLMALVKMAPLGIQMLLSGRFAFLPESIRNRRQLDAILDNVDAGGGKSNGKPMGTNAGAH